jgi:hypothetical protein
VWLVEEFAGLQGEIEDPFQDGELAVEFSVRHACNGAALFRHMRAGPVLPPDVVRLTHRLSLGLARQDPASSAGALRPTSRSSFDN